MKRKITLLFFLLSLVVNAQLTVRINEPTSNFRSVSFTSASNGFACKNNGIYKTTDNGINWSLITTPALPVNKLFFLNDTNGFATGQTFTSGSSPSIIKTTDSGTTWTGYTIPVTSDERLDALFFTSLTTGYIAGQGSKIYRTTDGGENWSLVHTGGGEFKDIYFVNPTLGFAVGSNGTILKTTNGISWSPKASGVMGFINAINFISPTIGFAAGTNGVILKTTDGGETWNTAYTTAPLKTLNDVVIVNNKIFVAGTALDFNPNQNVLLTSIDNGTTWNVETLVGPQGINEISFITENKGFIAGFNGVYEYNTPLNTNDFENVDFAIYPNPSNGIFTIKTNDTKNLSWKVYNNLGQKVSNGNSSNIDLTSFASGLYLLELNANGIQKQIKKIIKK
jgi:photosystem II stability/assembly factor-like uncharacterized protein